MRMSFRPSFCRFWCSSHPGLSESPNCTPESRTGILLWSNNSLKTSGKRTALEPESISADRPFFMCDSRQASGSAGESARRTAYILRSERASPKPPPVLMTALQIGEGRRLGADHLRTPVYFPARTSKLRENPLPCGPPLLLNRPKVVTAGGPVQLGWDSVARVTVDRKSVV